MITDKDARELVESLRICAEQNKASGNAEDSDYSRGQCHGRAAAYTLAAKWIEELIREKEAKGGGN